MSVELDSNVVSELIRLSPEPSAKAWAAGYALEDPFFPTVGEAEMRYGAAILPAGRRHPDPSGGDGAAEEASTEAVAGTKSCAVSQDVQGSSGERDGMDHGTSWEPDRERTTDWS